MNKAKREWEDAVACKALKEVVCPYPEGTVLVEWKNDRYDLGKINKTGRRAALKVFRKNEQWMFKYGIPNIGDLILRYLLKNGKPSKKAIMWKYVDQDCWLPEGQDYREGK